MELLAGTNRDEWLMYIDADAAAGDLRRWVDATAPGRREELLAAVAGDDPRRAMDRLRTARRMLCPSRYLARRFNAAGGRAWVYSFTRQRPGAGGAALGAYHGAELPYVFDRHDDWLATAAPDRHLTTAMGDYWSRFARTGAPADAAESWPPFTQQNSAVMELGERIGLTAAVDEDLCALLGPAQP
jgi:para-nitrobenzyl esterase